MKYELTPEHRAQLEPWAKRWIANAMSTEPMTEQDKAACVEAAHGLYAAADLPPPKHVVFVPSPFVLAFAGGFAAAIWHASRHGWPATKAATRDATKAATADATAEATRDAAMIEASVDAWDATGAATWDATSAATEAASRPATGAAMRVAMEAASRPATWSATGVATWVATRDATWRATTDATDAATAATAAETDGRSASAWDDVSHDSRSLADRLGVGWFGLACAERVWHMWQGGHQWSDRDAYLSFCQDVLKLPIDYSKYRHWRTLAERSGPRIVHPDFCMISDRPERLLVDEQNRPHCDDGPFCRWRDGSALYAIHGVRVPKQVVEAPETLTAEQVRAERNAEVRRVMLDRYGGLRGGDAAGKWWDDIGAKPVDVDEAHGWLYRAELDDDEALVMLRVTCPSTGRVYFIRVPPEMQTAREARAWTFGKDPATFAPEAET